MKSKSSQNNKWQNLKKSLGPGILMALAAIGASELVQATRAGSEYGFALTWAIILACASKYPFLEYGPRYAVATKESLIDGYKRLSPWVLLIYGIYTLSTMFIIVAAVTLVTASLAAELTGIVLSPFIWSLIVGGLCVIILFSGQYPLLDSIAKIIGVILALSTIIAVIAAVTQGSQYNNPLPNPSIWTSGGVFFLIALMGWMPLPVEGSVFNSLWTLERMKQTKYRPTLKESRIDFNIGYLGAAVMPILFLTLGALIMHGSGISFASSSAVFANQLINLFTSTLGDWSYPVFIAATFTTMFSTTITLTDAYPRASKDILKLFFPKAFNKKNDQSLYRFLVVLVPVLSFSVILLIGKKFTLVIDIATTLSFLISPVIAYFNFKLVTSDNVPQEYRPSKWLRWMSWGGIIFMAAFTILFFYWRIYFG